MRESTVDPAEVQRQLLLEERARHILARVRANARFMAGVRDAASARARGERGTPFRDLKRISQGAKSGYEMS